MMEVARSAFVVLLSIAGAPSERGSDWPTWRYDAARSAESPLELPHELYLQWVRYEPALTPAYRNRRLQFDRGYEPVVQDGRVFIASSRNDSVTAVDLRSGEELWRFYTDGPVRFAPVAWKDGVYFGSDDGQLYCVDSHSGTLRWKIRAAPSERRLLGNDRLISVWPVRGGPVISDGVVYFAAGVWSFEGVFVYAVDAASGEVLWVNDSTSFLYGPHPHDTHAIGGLTPQGYLVVSGDDLFVPCGAALPARFDRHSGRLKFFELPSQGKHPGSWFTAAAKARRRGLEPPVEPETDKPARLISSSTQEQLAGSGLAFDNRLNRDRHEDRWHLTRGDAGVHSRITLGGRDVKFEEGWPGVEGTIHAMLAAEGRLLVVTEDGRISCFGSEPSQVRHYRPRLERPRFDTPTPERAERLLKAAGTRHGIALVWGAGDGGLIDALLSRSNMYVIAIDRDADKVEALRRRWDRAGDYGVRVAVHVGDPVHFELPPYVAQLVTSGNVPDSGLDGSPQCLQQVLSVLRPYGGAVCIETPEDVRTRWRSSLNKAGVTELELAEVEGDLLVIRRPGALPGATDYTGGWSSPDQRVRFPLGVTWFNDTIGHFKRAPQPFFVGGLMISRDQAWLSGAPRPYPLQSPRYMDVYTGRELSEKERQAAEGQLHADPANQPVGPHGHYLSPNQTKPMHPPPPVVGERTNPLTGRSETRAPVKAYGCDGGADYGYLYTMRSGTAAYYDKRLESGTVHISGPRSGCTNSVIPANGLLNVPYFYQGCTCSYPLPVGLALAPVPPEHEQWCVWGAGEPDQIQRVGINFGAPGERMTEEGTLWVSFPSAGSPAPDLSIETRPVQLETYYRHALWIRGGDGWPWVTASGVEGLEELTITRLRPGDYAVRMYFAELHERKPAERLLDITIQDELTWQTLDVVREAGGPLRGLVRECATKVGSAGTLRIRLHSRQGPTSLAGLEVIHEGLVPGSVVHLPEKPPLPMRLPAPAAR